MRVTCPGCGNKIPVEQAGQIVTCGQCGKRLKVSGRPQEPPPQPTPPPPPSAPEQPSTTPIPRPEPLTMPPFEPLPEGPVFDRLAGPPTLAGERPTATNIPRPEPLTMPSYKPDEPAGFERFGEQYESGDVGQVDQMSGFETGRADDAALKTEVGGLTDMDPTGITDNFAVRNDGLVDIERLQTERAAVDAVNVESADLSEIENHEAGGDPDVVVTQVALEDMQQAVERDSQVGIKLDDTSKADAAAWAAKHRKRRDSGPSAAVLRMRMQRGQRLGLALYGLLPLVVLFAAVLLLGPPMIENRLYLGRWEGSLSSSGGTTVDVALDLRRAGGTAVTGALEFMPVNGALPAADQVPLAIKRYYTGAPLPVSGRFMRQGVSLRIEVDPAAPENAIGFDLAQSDKGRKLAGTVTVSATSDLELSLRRPRDGE